MPVEKTSKHGYWFNDSKKRLFSTGKFINKFDGTIGYGLSLRTLETTPEHNRVYHDQCNFT